MQSVFRTVVFDTDKLHAKCIWNCSIRHWQVTCKVYSELQYSILTSYMQSVFGNTVFDTDKLHANCIRNCSIRHWQVTCKVYSELQYSTLTSYIQSVFGTAVFDTDKLHTKCIRNCSIRHWQITCKVYSELQYSTLTSYLFLLCIQVCPELQLIFNTTETQPCILQRTAPITTLNTRTDWNCTFSYKKAKCTLFLNDYFSCLYKKCT
jgi:flavin-binding protein dodecin